MLNCFFFTSTITGQEDLDGANVLHVKSCPYLPGTANRYSVSSSRLSLKHTDSGCGRVTSTTGGAGGLAETIGDDEERDLSDSELLMDLGNVP